MQSNITSRKAVRSFIKGFLCLMLLSATFSSFAQPYVNGPFSTGATSSNGTAAPAGSTWSEVQTPNTNAGFSASITNNFKLGDDFVVPAGQTWNLSSIVFYGYQTGYASTTVSPFTTVRVTIHSGSITGPVVFGDQTTNRFASSASTNTYRIFNATPGTTRLIWSVTANAVTTLTAGTYWIEYATDVTGGAGHFMVPKTVVGQPTQAGNNGQQWNGTAWVSLVDGTNVQDMAFQVNYTSGPVTACNGTPAPGNTVSTITTGCPGTGFTLSPQNATTGSGVTYQWQSSTSSTGPFTNITGATGSTYSSTVTSTTFYQVIVTCGANSGTSTPVQVALTPPSGCYCTSNATSTADEDIFNVTVGGLNQSSTCTSVGPGTGSIQNEYSNYTSGTGAPAAATIIAGANNPFSIQVGTCGTVNYSNLTAVWIDLNQDGDFVDAGERVYVGSAFTGPHFETGNLVIPGTATAGVTRMRVKVEEFGSPATISACGTYSWGETEDYLVNIVPCVQAAITGQPANTSAMCGATATFTASATGSFPNFQWEYRTSPTGNWTLITNNPPYSVTSNTSGATTTSTLTINPTASSMNGYQYRAIVTGSCTGSGPDFTNPATLTVTPLVLNVSPTSANYCSAGGTPVAITVPNSTNTVTFTNNTVVVVPDGSNTGTSSTIAVTGIPVGANILRIAATINMTHTWVGDMLFNLKSPTSTATTGIINLIGFLNGGTGSNSTANFVNTTVASDATNPMSGAAAPRTGTFGADGYLTPGLPSGGGGANVTNWSTLLSTPNANGNWVLYMVDGGAGDIGTLQNWTLSITYGAAPATGVFTPIAGLYTNAAGTTPYTGSPVSQVYAAPTATTTYSVVVSSGACSTAAQSVTITVNSPVTGPITVANQTTCEGTNATFTATGIGGGPNFVYQWQSAPAATPTAFTNIPGANSATYTVTNPTTTQSGTVYRVVVSTPGCGGSVNSSGGTITVNPTPVVVISAAPIRNLYPGLTTTLTAASSPSAVTSYQWYRNGVAVSGATSNSLVVGIDGLGTYTVKVTDVNGCTNGSGFTSIPASITIGDSANNEILFIYPSPTSGRFQVRSFIDASRLANAPYVINVYDEKGQRVFTRRYTSTLGYTPMFVDLGAHGKGVYRVELTNSRGDRIKTGSVLVF